MAVLIRSPRVRFAAAVVLYLIWICALAALVVWSGARPPSAFRTSASLDHPTAGSMALREVSGKIWVVACFLQA